jgi:hypothetical protein
MKIKDDGNVIIYCSNCNKPLIDLLITNSDADFIWKCIAECCYCGDKSFIKEVKGIFRPGGCVTVNEKNPDHFTQDTLLLDIITEEDRVIFKTEKGNKNV